MNYPNNAEHYKMSKTSTSNNSDSFKKSAPSTPSKAVNFNENPENEKQREKYLTAKYGAHQMALIRKRLKVEMWMFDQLQELQDTKVRNYLLVINLKYCS